MVVPYPSVYNGGWSNNANDRVRFQNEVQEERRGSSDASEVSADGDEAARFRVFRYSWKAQWKWGEASRLWHDIDRMSDIEPLHLPVLFRSGPFDVNDYVRSSVNAWTRFILNRQIKFIGPNACATSVTGGDGVEVPFVITADRPVPFDTAVRNVECDVRHSFLLPDDGGEIRICDPTPGGQEIGNGIIYLSPHSSIPTRRPFALVPEQLNVLWPLIGCSRFQSHYREVIVEDAVELRTRELREGLASQLNEDICEELGNVCTLEKSQLFTSDGIAFTIVWCSQILICTTSRDVGEDWVMRGDNMEQYMEDGMKCYLVEKWPPLSIVRERLPTYLAACIINKEGAAVFRPRATTRTVRAMKSVARFVKATGGTQRDLNTMANILRVCRPVVIGMWLSFQHGGTPNELPEPIAPSFAHPSCWTRSCIAEYKEGTEVSLPLATVREVSAFGFSVYKCGEIRDEAADRSGHMELRDGVWRVDWNSSPLQSGGQKCDPDELMG